jgi:hypothetical protein
MALAKENLLRDLRLQRDKIIGCLNETYFAAESAVDDLFSDQGSSDALEKLDELNTLLKKCRERFASVSNIIATFQPICLLPKQIQVSN